jgi:Flp pilus assembly protein TadG
MIFHRQSDEPVSRGQAMVEFALIVPLLALFIVIAVDFGRAFFSYVQIANGAREAAALGAGNPSGPIDNAAMRDRVLLEAGVHDQGGENSTIVVTAECHDSAGLVMDCGDSVAGPGAGNTVTVTVTRDFSLITPLASAILGGDFKMQSNATAPVLGYATGGSGGGAETCSSPTASFEVTVLSGLQVEVDPTASTPLEVGGTCNLSGFFWTWGDGDDDPGNATAAQHTFANAGTYTIQLDVTNQEGTATTTRQVTVPSATPVDCDPPTAMFTFTTTGSGANRWFTYIDQSTVTDDEDCPITAWLWTFHAKGGVQSNAQFPAAFQYSSGGSKSVTLEVTNAGGTHSLTKSTP